MARVLCTHTQSKVLCGEPQPKEKLGRYIHCQLVILVSNNTSVPYEIGVQQIKVLISCPAKL